MVLSLTACGSGGGGSNSSPSRSPSNNQPVTVSGVAAIGAPLSGGSVFVNDASGTEHGPYPIDANGNYSINVTGFNNPPFYLRAEGTVNGNPITLYSVSMNPGTANINPLTNLAVAVAAGVNNPADVYDDPVAHPVGQTELNDAINDILALLAPILENPAYLASNINPLTDDDYKADGTGLDGVIDDLGLSIDITNGIVTISLNGIELDQASINNLKDSFGDITESEVNEALAVVSGTGQTCPFPATLNLNVTVSGEGSLSYDFEDTFLQATSINAPTIADGTATITGAGTLNGAPGHTFTATVKDGSPDKMSMEIDGVSFPVPGSGPLPVIDGSGFTLH